MEFATNVEESPKKVERLNTQESDIDVRAFLYYTAHTNSSYPGHHLPSTSLALLTDYRPGALTFPSEPERGHFTHGGAVFLSI